MSVFVRSGTHLRSNISAVRICVGLNSSSPKKCFLQSVDDLTGADFLAGDFGMKLSGLVRAACCHLALAMLRNGGGRFGDGHVQTSRTKQMETRTVSPRGGCHEVPFPSAPCSWRSTTFGLHKMVRAKRQTFETRCKEATSAPGVCRAYIASTSRYYAGKLGNTRKTAATDATCPEGPCARKFLRLQ
jgi:hypothetical protein